jgi:hypothetical protein
VNSYRVELFVRIITNRPSNAGHRLVTAVRNVGGILHESGRGDKGTVINRYEQQLLERFKVTRVQEE